MLAPARRRWRGVVTLACAILPLMLSADARAAPGVGGSRLGPAEIEPAAELEDPPEPPAVQSEPAAPAPPPELRPEPPTPAAKDLDNAWAALVERDLNLHMRDDTSIQCQLLGVQAGLLVCTRDSDGLVFTVDRARVAKVYIQTPKREAGSGGHFDGSGLLVSGIIATTIGGALALATVGMAAYCMSDYYGGVCPYFTIPLGVTSAAGLGAGIPLIVLGKRKRQAFREAQAAEASPTLTPAVARLDSGVAGSLTLRF